MNIGLLAGAARAFYVNPGYRRDTKVLSTTAAATFALLGLEGYGAAWYANTPKGQAEAKKAKEEGTLVYRHAREQILRPGVLGGLLGLGKQNASLALGRNTDRLSSQRRHPRWSRVLLVHQLGQADLGQETRLCGVRWLVDALGRRGVRDASTMSKHILMLNPLDTLLSSTTRTATASDALNGHGHTYVYCSVNLSFLMPLQCFWRSYPPFSIHTP